MSDVTKHPPREHPREEKPSDPGTTPRSLPSDDGPGVTISRRRLIQGAGATLGLVAAGALPRFIAAATASESAEEGATGLEHITEHDGAVNYPGQHRLLRASAR